MEKERFKELDAELKAEDVLNALEDLSEEEFEKFKWFLQQPASIPGLPTIRKKKLARAQSINIVDLMVQTYTLQRCMEVTTKILKKINRNDLLQRLLFSKNLENRMCLQHKSPLELFCWTDQTHVCVSCSELNHKNHELVPLSTEHMGNEEEPRRRRDNEVKQMIEKNEMKIQEITEIVKNSKDAAEKEKVEGFLVTAALKESAERFLKKLIKEIEDKQKTTEKEAKDFIKDLEQETSELKKQDFEDDGHQCFSSLKADPPKKNWTEVRVHPPSYEGTVERAVAELKETLWEDMKKQLQLKRVQQYAVDLTLDPDTAHPKLILSDDRKQVKHGDVWQNLPNKPKRFSTFANVLGNESFSSGRFYFEVQVKGKTDWDLGVARESVDRKGDIAPCTEYGIWAVVLRNGNEYSTGDDTTEVFDLHPGPEKVGVFVDYEEGLVSFYDVDAAALIYSFTGCCFTEKLYPYFSPFLNNGGENSAPLIICPVNQAVCCSVEAQ
ncbi:PREDICTED: E3 ubiquitin-protein ligase TRIM39-like [Cyprinodon variegatus]|uniref:E3 ubiquitin-protein ligase TRIM39-like n=1 Tax=Cyprinodon variegatus TaxID=28743 RepID=UPI0007429E3E|nr:PREDICTED: E3 ubiquitin-protein ligase TRIM39-like [Cyprinodon variegatus]